MKQRIFLTGATSYVGTKFIELYGDRFDIFGISRTDSTNPVSLLDFAAVAELYRNFNPDFVIHLAADLGRDAASDDVIIKTNPSITQNLIDLASPTKTPIIFTSTEAVYGGKENGDYSEDAEYLPRSAYGESKVMSEKIVKDSGLPYLITRGHRHVGISKRYSRPKQFPDALKELVAGREIYTESKKLFTPVLINNVCDIFAHYITNDFENQLVLNMGVDEQVSYFTLLKDVAEKIDIDTGLVKSDGVEAGWPNNSSLSISRLHELGYPSISYRTLLSTIGRDFAR